MNLLEDKFNRIFFISSPYTGTNLYIFENKIND